MATRPQFVSQEQDPYLSLQPNSNDLALVPYAVVNGVWTLSDAQVLAVGERAREQGILETVFIDGNVRTPEQFLQMMKTPANVPVFAFWGTESIGVAWLNGCSGKHAFGHFLFLQGGRGEKARKAGRLILKYWQSFEDNEGPLFDVILGLVPSTNAKAVQYAEDIGLTKVGEIPRISRGRPGTLLYLAG